MNPIHPFLYQELKQRHDSKAIKLEDIHSIQLEKVEELANLPIIQLVINLTTGRNIKKFIQRKNLANIAEEGVLLTSVLPTSIDELSVVENIDIEELHLADIELSPVDETTVMLRAINESLLYYGTVLIKQV